MERRRTRRYACGAGSSRRCATCLTAAHIHTSAVDVYGSYFRTAAAVASFAAATVTAYARARSSILAAEHVCGAEPASGAATARSEFAPNRVRASRRRRGCGV